MSVNKESKATCVEQIHYKLWSVLEQQHLEAHIHPDALRGSVIVNSVEHRFSDQLRRLLVAVQKVTRL